MFKLDVIQAKEGDCLILHFDDDNGTMRKLLIDGGPPGVYKKFLEPRLEQMRQQAGAPLQFDLGMVSHIDSDHVAGMLDMTKKMIGRKNAGKPAHYAFTEFWHNSFGGITGGVKPATIQGLETAAVAAAGDDTLAGLDYEDNRAGAIIASVKQGAKLEDNLITLGIPNNDSFANGLVLAPDFLTFLGLDLTVVGPLKTELDALQEKWKDDLPEAKVQEYLDKSVPNLSSLAFLVEKGSKKILLTGDARGDKLIEGLELTGKLPAGETLKLDLFKAPHHGSARNVEQDLFERLPADKYVISADGKHHNPDLATLSMLINARKIVEPTAPFEIILAMEMKTDDLQNQLVNHMEHLKTQRNFSYTFGPGPNGHSIEIDI